MGPSLGIIGGGLAGLAAAEAAARAGLQVELFEAHRQLGGRAGSFRDPHTGQWVDHCQHVALGCCTNFLEFCRRTELEACFERSRRMHFIGPDGQVSPLAPAAWLPAPLHFAPSLLRMRHLSWTERLRLATTIRRLAQTPAEPHPDEPTIAAWLATQGASSAAIDGFWNPVLVSALSEGPARIAVSAARQVLCEGMLTHRQAAELYLPRVPLTEIYDETLKKHLTAASVQIHCATGVRHVLAADGRAAGLRLSDGSVRHFDFVLSAVPWHAIGRIIPPELPALRPTIHAAEQLAAAPITAAHLWYDRPVSPLPHAILVGRLSQWVFQRPVRGWDHSSQPCWHVQVVISGAHELDGAPRQAVLDRVSGELQAVWPAAAAARLLHWRVVTRPAAVFAPLPGSAAFRPAQATPVNNLFLAGDWTASGWPATMEGAVRSGYLAVERLLEDLGRRQHIVVPPLRPAWLSRCR